MACLGCLAAGCCATACGLTLHPLPHLCPLQAKDAELGTCNTNLAAKTGELDTCNTNLAAQTEEVSGVGGCIWL